MTLVLDSGGISALAGHRARLAELRRRGLWPAQVPAVALAEALTGDHRRDFHTNRLLRACQIRGVAGEDDGFGTRVGVGGDDGVGRGDRSGSAGC